MIHHVLTWTTINDHVFFAEGEMVREVLEGGITELYLNGFSVSLFLGSFIVCHLMNN